jgi:hypothetical protein
MADVRAVSYESYFSYWRLNPKGYNELQTMAHPKIFKCLPPEVMAEALNMENWEMEQQVALLEALKGLGGWGEEVLARLEVKGEREHLLHKCARGAIWRWRNGWPNALN